MLRKSSRSTREAIVTPVSALIMASAGSVLSAPYEARAIKSIELQASQDIFLFSFLSRAARWQLSRAGGDSADQKSCGGEVGHGNESSEFATQVSLRGVVPQVEASNDRGRLVESSKGVAEATVIENTNEVIHERYVGREPA